MERRYGVLRMVSGIYRFVGYLLLAGALIALLMVVPLGLNFLLQCLWGAVTLSLAGLAAIALSELIMVLIDIESNTRRISYELAPPGRPVA